MSLCWYKILCFCLQCVFLSSFHFCLACSSNPQLLTSFHSECICFSSDFTYIYFFLHTLISSNQVHTRDIIYVLGIVFLRTRFHSVAHLFCFFYTIIFATFRSLSSLSNFVCVCAFISIVSVPISCVIMCSWSVFISSRLNWLVFCSACVIEIIAICIFGLSLGIPFTPPGGEECNAFSQWVHIRFKRIQPEAILRWHLLLITRLSLPEMKWDVFHFI